MSTSRTATSTWSWMDDVVPFVAMLMITSLDMAALTIVKSAMNDGLDSIIYVIYHGALGTLILLPFFSFHVLRNVDRPPLTLRILFRFFVLGLFGICFAEELWYVGVDYSSPTMASVIGNLSPGVIFLIAVLFRMEKIDLRSSSSVAKLIGTTTAVSGAMVYTFYQEPTLIHTTGSPSSPNQLFFFQPSKWTLGGLIIATGGTFACVWLVLQTATAREYPDQQTIVFFYNLFGTIQCIALFPFLGRDRSAWILQRGIMVTAIIIGGVYSVVVRRSVLTWCLWKKGPVFTSMFSPLSIVLGVIMGVTFLGESIHLGSVIGAIIIAVGFYMVIWGQAKEKKNILAVTVNNLDISDEPSSSHQTDHLLSSKNESEC
ncbi:WAT1-related protein At5g40240-like [Bidens hawaiensis]|uniref:WAT1-related protein At5g40240-like n=1 Tax=Bidens hawaiensis TaxID=980011 RepID=UPI00404AAA46